MSVLPGSLDYLYYNGILDHIPYEAYETAPAAQPVMNGSQYLDYAMKGNAYNTYNSPDTFVARNNADIKEGQNFSAMQSSFGIGNDYGRDADYEVMANGQDGKSFRQSITEAAGKAADGYSKAPSFVKGLISGGIIAGTLLFLFRGKKTPAVHTAGNGSKLNPKNWFKK